jgi:hypothetical protein
MNCITPMLQPPKEPHMNQKFIIAISMLCFSISVNAQAAPQKTPAHTPENNAYKQAQLSGKPLPPKPGKPEKPGKPPNGKAKPAGS